MNRREFIRAASALAVAPAAGCVAGRAGSGARGRMLVGTCASFENLKRAKEAGCDFWEASVGMALAPKKDREWWKAQRDRILAAPLPLRSCNGFIPGDFRLTGPNAAHEPALAYAETALRRAEEVCIRTIVFGSSGARNVPGDFSGPREKWPDTEKGVRQYADFCRELCRRTADLKTVRIVIEPLCPKESNIVNYVWQGLQICEEIDSPRLGVLADLYHMAAGGESADSIVRAKDRLYHCHVAEPVTRAYPGADPQLTPRLKPYFAALAEIGYAGGISCECGWRDDFNGNIPKAVNTIKELAS